MAVDIHAAPGRRILFTASTWSHLANFHRPYLRALADRGYLVDGACGGAPADLPELARAVPLSLEKKMTSPKNLAAAAQIRRLLASGEYDLVSCHTALAAFFTRLAVEALPKSKRPRVVCIAHGYLFDQNTSAAKTALLAGAEKLTAPVTDLVLTMNRWDFDYASAHRLGRRVANIPGMGVDFSPLDRADPQAGLALREELGFEGVAMTDDLDMDAVQKYVEEGTAPVMSLQAGADLVLTSDPQGGIPSVLEAVETGALTWDRLDQSVLRVLRWKLQLGLLSLPGAEDVQTS